MKFRFLSIILIILTFHLSGFSQSKNHGLVEENQILWAKQADQLLLEKSYFNAIDLYLKALDNNFQNLYLNHQLAETYYKTRDYKNAVRYFTNSTGLDKEEDREYPYDLFYLGESLRSLGEYENAKVQYIKFYKQKVRTLEFKEFTNYAKQGIKGCDYALEKIQEDSTNFKINHLENGINHAYSDFSPTIYMGDLYFSSLREDTVLTYAYGDEPKSKYLTKVYFSEPSSDLWGEPKEFLELNSKDFHTANPSFSLDKRTMYYTECWNSHHNDIYCQIFRTHRDEKNEWSKPHKMHHHVNAHSYTSTQPNISYLTSGKGNKDTTEILYFVSNRPGGFGGMDIWYTELDQDGKPKRPINCGKKINSSRDEISPFFDNDSKLYFSSDYHVGFGGFDVFYSKGARNKWYTPVNLDLPINSSYDESYYQLVQQKDTLEKGLIASNRPGGIALKNETCCEDIYSFAEYLPKYLPVKLELLTTLAISDTNTYVDSVYTVKSGKKILELKERKEIVTRDTIVPFLGAKIGLVKKINADEAKKLGKYSLEGMSSQIEWVDTNNLSGNLGLTLKQNKEYVMIIVHDSITTIFQEFNTRAENDFTFQMTKKVKVVKDSLIETKEVLSGTLAQIDENQEIKENQKFLLENMYFDTDKDLIKDASLPSLELLLEFMESRPKVKMEIAGHTDSQGNDSYNLDLSQRRAESVKKYLIDHGIKEKRLVAKGYGEEEPIATNETAEGRQLNRRTEIKILSTE